MFGDPCITGSESWIVTDKRVENMIRNTDAVHEDCEHVLLNKDVIRQVKKGTPGKLDHNDASCL